jgi:hypothetical protein
VATTRVHYQLRTRGYGCSGHPAFPTPSRGREISCKASGASRREGEVVSDEYECATPSTVIAAKAGDPVFRDANDGIEKPQRTGYSAFAEYDGLGEERSDEAIHSFFALRDGLLRGACHRAALCADPLARNDGSLWPKDLFRQ